MTKDIADWKQALVDGAKKAATTENVAATTGSVSTKGGIFTMPDGSITKDLTVVIVAYIAKRKWYENRGYDPEDKRPPICFAQATEEQFLMPHTNVPIKPLDAYGQEVTACEDCPNSEWESMPGTSKAQWCKMSRELMVMVIDEHTTASSIATADLLSVSIPPTSLKAWGKYAVKLAADGLPPWAVSTKMSIAPSKYMFAIDYELVTPLNQDATIMAAIHARVQPTEDAMLESAYTYDEEEEASADKKKANF